MKTSPTIKILIDTNLLTIINKKLINTNDYQMETGTVIYNPNLLN